MSEFEPRTEVEKEELGLYLEQKNQEKESNLDRLGKIAFRLVVIGLISVAVIQIIITIQIK